MTPAEVLERFTEEELIRLIAYQNVYGPITRQRDDILTAQLSMMITAPYGKKGHRPKIKDYLIQWSRRRKSPEELIAAIEGVFGGGRG